MNRLFEKIFFISFSLILVLSFTSCNSVDPNIAASSEADYGYSVVVSSDNTENSDNMSETSDSSLLDDDYFAKRSYELCYLLAQTSFEKPEDISINAIVQYAFCHIFYDDLTKMPKEGINMREATADQINSVIKEHFGVTGLDITKSDLYNSGNDRFEMWEPLYGTEIYYDVSHEKKTGMLYEVTSVFYNDKNKTERKGKVVLTVEKDGKDFYIKKLSSSK